MIRAHNLREPLDLPPARARRYFTADHRVICDMGSGTYLLCTIDAAMGDGAALAQTLADTLNRNPFLVAA